MYTGTWAEQMPTQRPLMTRPTINMAIFCEAETMTLPMHLEMGRQTKCVKTKRAAGKGEPDDGANHDGLLSAEDVRNVAGSNGTKPRSTGHGGGDAALHVGRGASA